MYYCTVCSLRIKEEEEARLTFNWRVIVGAESSNSCVRGWIIYGRAVYNEWDVLYGLYLARSDRGRVRSQILPSPPHFCVGLT